MNFTLEQKEIINSKASKIAVMSSAATGKTSVLVERVKYLLDNDVPTSKIAIITFTRMAASELKKRLSFYNIDDMFIGTIHSLAANFLVKNGQGQNFKKIAEDEEFDKLFSACMKTPEIINGYDYVLWDEVQDSDKKQLQFIFNFLKPKNLFVVYDIKQSIYGFRGAAPKTLQQYLYRDKDFVYYELTNNFRNGSEILSYAKNIISKNLITDNSKACSGIASRVVQVSLNDKIFNQIKVLDTYKDWAILTRSNQQLEKIVRKLKSEEIPYVTFKQSQLNRDSLLQKMNENKVKVLTIHSAKGLEFKNVVVHGAKWYNEEEIFINYVAATRAKQLLIWT